VNAELKILQKLPSQAGLWQSNRTLMKTNPTVLLALTAVSFALFVSGCASSGPSLVLAPVGPSLPVADSTAGEGTLLVYSAFKTGVPSPYLPDDIRQHTSYELRSADGKLLQVVPNEAGYQGEDPVPMHLPAGHYRITARANGHGLVVVPVVIVEKKVTTVHLEGGVSWPDKDALTDANSVRLPDGGIVGWKAVEENKTVAGSR
jgi:hypothetical protein